MTYEEKHEQIWLKWKEADAAATTQAEVDAAHNLYIQNKEDLSLGFGHPPGKPRRRPTF